jgi:hypothetical protein
MSDLRTAARQALEALMWHDETVRTRGDDEAIEALRAALEQYDKDRVWIEERKTNWALQRKLITETPERDKQQQEYEEARSAALEQPDRAQKMRDAGYTRRPTMREMADPEQPEQEPVAWMTPGQDLHFNNGEGFRFSDWTPLYTRPPRRRAWRGLTEEEINEATFHPDGCMNTHIEFARAIEAALKERNA